MNKANPEHGVAASDWAPDPAIMELMDELVFEVVQEGDGGFCAECLTDNIFTQADSWEELRRNVVEAVTAFYFDGNAPASVRLHLVRDEILSVA